MRRNRKGARSSSPRRTRRGSTTWRRAPSAPPPPILRGLALPWRTSSMPAAPAVPDLRGRCWRACAKDRRRAQGREAPARRGRHRLRQRGRDPGRGQCRLGAVPGLVMPRSCPSRCRSATAWGSASIGGGTLQDAFQAVEQGAAEAVIVLENDLYRHAERAAVDRCLDRARHVIVIDHLLHETAGSAEIVLPAGDVHRGRRHLGEQRGPSPALLPTSRAGGRYPGELALAARCAARVGP